jgi:hypothetical protein
MGIKCGHKQDLDIPILDTQTPRQRHTMTGFVFDALSCSSRIGTKATFGESQNASTTIISIIFTNIAFIGLQRVQILFMSTFYPHSNID